MNDKITDCPQICLKLSLLLQIFSVTLWFADEYIAYAIAIVIMSVVGIAASVYQLKKVRIIFTYL